MCPSTQRQGGHHVSLSSHAPSRVVHDDASRRWPSPHRLVDRRSQRRQRQASNGPSRTRRPWSAVGWKPSRSRQRAGRPPLKSLGSFHDDGTMVCSDQGAVTTDPPSVFSSCHGAWTHLEKRTFAYTSRELISDLSGNLVGYLKVRGVYTVSRLRRRVHRLLLRGDRRCRWQRAVLGQRDQRGRADQGRTALRCSARSTRVI